MMGMLVVLVPWNGTSEGDVFSNTVFPYMVYVVPNALFPLMTYFLWMRFSIYKTYLTLYMAGKTIFVVSVVGWCIFSFYSIIRYLITETAGIVTTGVVLVMAVADILSILGGLLLQKKLNRLEALEPTMIVSNLENQSSENGDL
jgi:hypothetical protein